MTKIDKLLLSLRKELKKEYPARHWKHLVVFTGFWNLVSQTDTEDIFDK